MPKDEMPPEFLDVMRTWFHGWGGTWGLALIPIAGAGFYIWSNWDKVRTWPGMPWVVERITRRGVPHADPTRFTILVARLDNDAKGEQRNLLLHGLHECKGVEVLPLDRTIAADGLGRNRPNAPATSGRAHS